jgi:hypothetical protein
MSAARVFLTSLVPLRLRHWANRPQALGALITISSRNEGDDEDHFTSHSLFMDGSYFGQINNPTSERVVRLPTGNPQVR